MDLGTLFIVCRVLFPRPQLQKASDLGVARCVGNPSSHKKQIIFAQGDSADAVFYIQQGKIKLTVLSTIGKESNAGHLW